MAAVNDQTRLRLLQAATDLFAEQGFNGASVREITRRAEANQAAITYYFGGKDGLYRDVLVQAVEALSATAVFDERLIDTTDRDELVLMYVRQLFAPLVDRRRAGRFLRIFAWEQLAPTQVFLDFLASGQFPILRQGRRIVERFLPGASEERLALATIWLSNQAAPFVRHADLLALPPLNLHIDGGAVDRWANAIGRMAIAGLLAMSGEPQPVTRRRVRSAVPEPHMS